MGKKANKNITPLGKCLIKNQRQLNKGRKFTSDKSLLHTTEVPDGYDWGRLNLQSVTEESSFQEFLSTAELAGTEFSTEKLNITFVNPATNIGLLTDEETKKVKEDHEKNKGELTIPRRPPWNSDMTINELENNEREHFLEWRRKLAVLQEDKNLLMTPYEKNLEFWRQLWRVVERSDVIVQIVDARNPLLFRCSDLEKYVKEISPEKQNLILLNKADFLTEKQRLAWLEYFNSIGVQSAFYSAVLAADEKSADEIVEEEIEKSNISSDEDSSEPDDESSKNIISNMKQLEKDVELTESKFKILQNKIETTLSNFNLNSENLTETSKLQNKNTVEANVNCENSKEKVPENEYRILTRQELIDLFKTIYKGKTNVTEGVTTIGLVGYPNVGKSSTINSLLSVKKVSVSATPGKTKHFQTLFLDSNLLLCDCPGLVMPSFVFTKAEMIINGILPIDQMRDHVPAVNLVARLIPRHILEDQYGIILPKPPEEENNPDRPPTSEELLNAYGYIRGFMTANGQPDNPRTARYVLKDFVKGKLLYATAPPDVDQNQYHTFPERTSKVRNYLPPREARVIKSLKTTASDIDSAFFKNSIQGVHIKGKVKISSNSSQEVRNSEKPWKEINKHTNKNKREKLRRVYAHLDQH